METQERILLTENDEAISSVTVNAQANVRALNKLHELYPIKSEAEAREAVARKGYLIRQMMEGHHKKFLDVINDVMTLKMPPHIIEINSALDQVADRMNKDSRLPGLFPFTKFDGSSWRVDQEALESYCERFKKFAHTDHQLKIYFNCKELAELLNSIQLGEQARLRNFRDNELVIYDRPSGKWVINIGTIIRAEREEVFKF